MKPYLLLPLLLLAGCTVTETDVQPLFTTESLDGPFSLEEELNKTPILINFWASWCYPCELEMPLLEQLHQEHGDNIQVIGVNMGEKEKTVRETVDDWNITFTIVYDKDGSIKKSYNAIGQPTTFLLSPSGEIIWEKMGILLEEDFEFFIESIR